MSAEDIDAAERAAVAAEKARALEQDFRTHEKQCSERWKRIVWTIIAITGFLLVVVFRDHLTP